MWDVDDGSRRKTKGRLQSLSCEGNKLRKERISPQKLSHKRTIQSAEGEMCLIFSPILSSSIMCQLTKGKENRSSRDVKTIEARFARQQLSHFDTSKNFFFTMSIICTGKEISFVCAICWTLLRLSRSEHLLPGLDSHVGTINMFPFACSALRGLLLAASLDTTKTRWVFCSPGRGTQVRPEAWSQHWI